MRSSSWVFHKQQKTETGSARLHAGPKPPLLGWLSMCGLTHGFWTGITGRDRECRKSADLRDAYVWVVMSDNSKTTSPQHWSVNTTLTYSPQKSDRIFRSDFWSLSQFWYIAWIKKPDRTPSPGVRLESSNQSVWAGCVYTTLFSKRSGGVDQRYEKGLDCWSRLLASLRTRISAILAMNCLIRLRLD